MKIYIPSSKRGRKQTTFDNLPASIKVKTAIVIPKGEGPQYAGYPFIEIEQRGIGPTRQWCVENVDVDDKVVMLDDDLVFATRRDDEPTKFRPSSPQEIEALFNDVFIGLDDFAHVGVGTREGGNYKTDPSYQVGRMLRILAYDTKILKQHGIRFDRLDVMEDFDVTLRLLRKGYANHIINWIVHNQNGSNLAGGCSQYRTKDLQAHAAHQLARHHGHFVAVVEKETKSAWGGGIRTDVRVQWRKAYDSSR